MIEIRTRFGTNSKPAKCISTDIKCPKGKAHMVPTQRCPGGKAVSLEAFKAFEKTGRLRGSLHRPDEVTEAHEIFMEFSISVPTANIGDFALQMAVEGWSLVGRVNQVTYKVAPAKPFLTCRGLQKALKTFDDIIGDNGGKITKFASVVDGRVIPEYRDCYYFYQQVDETCRMRKTAEKKSMLQIQNEAKLKAKKKAVKK